MKIKSTKQLTLNRVRPFFYGSSAFTTHEELFLMGMDTPLNFIRTPVEGCNVLVICGPLTLPKIGEIQDLYQRLVLPKVVILFGTSLSECSIDTPYLAQTVSSIGIKIDYWISGSPPDKEHLIEIFRSI